MFLLDRKNFETSDEFHRKQQQKTKLARHRAAGAGVSQTLSSSSLKCKR